jgi:hypothetical protein
VPGRSADCRRLVSNDAEAYARGNAEEALVAALLPASLRDRLVRLGMSSSRALLAIAAATLAALSPANAAAAQAPAKLLAKFQPALVFHPGEEFRPTSVESFVDDSVLEAATGTTSWIVVDPDPAADSLPTSSPPVWRLNQQPCFAGAVVGDLSCYVAGAAGAPTGTMYGRVVRDGEQIVLQYWLFYYDNVYRYPFLPLGAIWQSHEGDWEVVNVVLSSKRKPLFVGYSQHCSGETRPWAETPRSKGRHPTVFVALGSHANYFEPGLHEIHRACLPAQVIAFFLEAGLPLPADAVEEGAGSGQTTIERVGEGGQAWVSFPGFWGELEYFHAPPPIGTVQFGTSPVGPAFHAVWRQPLATLTTWR